MNDVSDVASKTAGDTRKSDVEVVSPRVKTTPCQRVADESSIHVETQATRLS